MMALKLVVDIREVYIYIQYIVGIQTNGVGLGDILYCHHSSLKITECCGLQFQRVSLVWGKYGSTSTMNRRDGSRCLRIRAAVNTPLK